MGICVSVSGQNNLQLDAVGDVSTCPYVLLTNSDYATFADVPTLQSIFAMPISTDLAQLWLVGFSLPVIIYLVSWGFGVVVNMFKSH